MHQVHACPVGINSIVAEGGKVGLGVDVQQPVRRAEDGLGLGKPCARAAVAFQDRQATEPVMPEQGQGAGMAGS